MSVKSHVGLEVCIRIGLRPRPGPRHQLKRSRNARHGPYRTTKLAGRRSSCNTLFMADAPDTTFGPEEQADDPTGRLAAYMARSQTPLDLLALLTLWIVVIPPGDFGHDASTAAVTVRICLSAIYGIDMAIRIALAHRHWQYFRTHLLGLAVVAVPPLRVVFSLRLVRSIFQRGHLSRFLLAASVLVLNGAVAVYFYERHAAGSNIHTLGESVWWAVTTVTTVGYGDFFPVTALGQIAASFIMAIAVLTLAVITAQVSSNFVEQAARRRTPAQTSPANTEDVTLADLAQRLARIEELLSSR
jgi:voltage-gated potassium channel